MNPTEKLEEEVIIFCRDNLIDLPMEDSPLDTLRKQDRRQEYVWARRFLAKLLREKYHWKYTRIGRFMHRDHSTIIYLLK